MGAGSSSNKENEIKTGEKKEGRTPSTLGFINFALYIFLLLAMLIYTLYLTEVDHQCVFGPNCCPENLLCENSSTGDVNMVATQVVNKSKIPEIMNNEELTFRYTRSNESANPAGSFLVTLDYENDVPSGGTCWPLDHGASSGYYNFSSSGTSGVSIFLKYYKQNTNFWENAYQVINEGMSVLIDQSINTTGTFVSLGDVTEGFIFSTKLDVSDEGKTVDIESTASGGTCSSFYTQLEKGPIVGNRSVSDNSTYSPLTSWVEFKAGIRGFKPDGVTPDPDACINNPENCSCIDPNAKGLPSCQSVFITGKGYVAGKDADGNDIYSKNCSNFSNVNQTAPGTPQYYVSQNVPRGSYMAGKITDNDATGQALSKDLALGNDGSYAGANQFVYAPSALFCGGGSIGNPNKLLYPAPDLTDKTHGNPTAAVLGTCIFASQVANARVIGEVYQLGFA